MYNQAVHSFSHFKHALFTLGIDGREYPFLGTHFSLITILFSPLCYLFGSYTLLFVQIASILSGGLAVYKYCLQRFDPDSVIPVIAVIQFFSIWGIYSALAFDYHDNVVGAMLLLWFLYFLEKRNILVSSLFLLLILFTKEIMGFWMFFVIAGSMIKNRGKNSHEFIRFEIPAALFCLFYSGIVTGFIMPILQDNDTNLQLSRYSLLGHSFNDMFTNILSKPKQILTLLFSNTTGDNAYDGIKTEFHLMLLFSGGICMLMRPSYLVMILPLYALKFFSDDYALWGINYHYSIEFVPLISIAVTDFTGSLRKHRTIVILLITLSTVVASVTTLEQRKSKWYNAQNSRFYSKSHYRTDLNLPEIYKAIGIIDRQAVISVSSTLAPHMANRERIYHFPVVKDADYIALIITGQVTYPLSNYEYSARCDEYRNSGLFEVKYESNDLLILRRKGIKENRQE